LEHIPIKRSSGYISLPNFKNNAYLRPKQYKNTQEEMILENGYDPDFCNHDLDNFCGSNGCIQYRYSQDSYESKR
jgi:hypothetical protein